MPTIRTAISLDESILSDVNQLAAEMKLSCSKVFVLAVTEYLQQYRNKRILDAINAAYDDFPDTDEIRVLDRHNQKRIEAANEPW